MIRYYEVRREEPFLFKLAEYRHATPQKSLGKISKRGLDTNKCEIFRFYKIHAENNWIEPVSMICPRRVCDHNLLYNNIEIYRLAGNRSGFGVYGIRVYVIFTLNSKYLRY